MITTGICHPRNLSADAKGSIHDDETATTLGFRGGTVAGDIHLEQFPGILTKAFGNTWFETGSLSMYFMHATSDREPVEAFLDIPESSLPLSNTQVPARMTTPEGIVVAEGTASCGTSSAPSALHARDRRGVDPSTLRMLRSVQIGQQLDSYTREAPGHRQRQRYEKGMMTVPLEWYAENSPWGGSICSPLTTCQLLVAGVTASIEEQCGEFVGMYGAIEVRYLNGPLFLDRDYTITGRVLDVSETPKTEVLWYTTEAREVGQSDSAPIASVTMMTRLLKESSPLYR
jgi:hypothetical protein